MRLEWMLVAASLAVHLHAQSSADHAVFAAMQQADPASKERAVMHRGQVAPDLDLVIAIGGEYIGGIDRSFFWEERNRLNLFFQERGSPEQVYAVASEPGFYDCIARVERATAADTVISCTGEKTFYYPNRRFVYDVAAKNLVSYSSYEPVAIRWLLPRNGGAVALGSNTDQFLAVDFQAGRDPEFEVLGEAEGKRLADQIPGAVLGVNYYFYPPEPDRRIGFGPSESFIWISGGDGPVEQATDGTLVPHVLSLSTREQLAAARPRKAADLSRVAQPNFDERIGPWQLERDRLWFGKTFYDSEGATGVGGFGYFDPASRIFQVFAPPEIVDWSASAILVEPDAVWLALVGRWEYGDYGGGVLRYDRTSGSIRKFETRDLIRQFLRVGDRLLLATDKGVSVIFNGQPTRYFADRTADGQWRVAEALTR